MVSQAVNDGIEEWDNDSVEKRYHFVEIVGIHKLRVSISEKCCGIEENYNCQVRGTGGKSFLAAMRRRNPDNGCDNNDIRCHHYTKGNSNDH